MICDLPLLRANLKRGSVAALGVVIAMVFLIKLQIFGTYPQLQEVTDDLRQSQDTLIAIEDAGRTTFFAWSCPTVPNRPIWPQRSVR